MKERMRRANAAASAHAANSSCKQNHPSPPPITPNNLEVPTVTVDAAAMKTASDPDNADIIDTFRQHIGQGDVHPGPDQKDGKSIDLN